MANKTCTALITTIRTRSARSNDSTLITEAFVLDALNEAQLEIARRGPGLIDLYTKDTTTFSISTDDTEVDISSLDPAHIEHIWILNGEDTRRAGLEFMDKGRFYRKYIRVANQSSSEPTVYTRAGNKIVFNCPVSSDYDGLYLRIDYTKWATVFPDTSSTAQSVLSNSDKGLIFFALAEIYDELAMSNPGIETKALKVRAQFEAWLSNYRDYSAMQTEELYE